MTPQDPIKVGDRLRLLTDIVADGFSTRVCLARKGDEVTVVKINRAAHRWPLAVQGPNPTPFFCLFQEVEKVAPPEVEKAMTVRDVLRLAESLARHDGCIRLGELRVALLGQSFVAVEGEKPTPPVERSPDGLAYLVPSSEPID